MTLKSLPNFQSTRPQGETLPQAGRSYQPPPEIKEGGQDCYPRTCLTDICFVCPPSCQIFLFAHLFLRYLPTCLADTRETSLARQSPTTATHSSVLGLTKEFAAEASRSACENHCSFEGHSAGYFKTHLKRSPPRVTLIWILLAALVGDTIVC